MLRGTWQAALAAMPWVNIQEVPNSNLSHIASHPDWGICCLARSLPATLTAVLIGDTAVFIVMFSHHNSEYNYTVYILKRVSALSGHHQLHIHLFTLLLFLPTLANVLPDYGHKGPKHVGMYIQCSYEHYYGE
jgi:hypothetical protein